MCRKIEHRSGGESDRNDRRTATRLPVKSQWIRRPVAGSLVSWSRESENNGIERKNSQPVDTDHYWQFHVGKHSCDSSRFVRYCNGRAAIRTINSCNPENVFANLLACENEMYTEMYTEMRRCHSTKHSHYHSHSKDAKDPAPDPAIYSDYNEEPRLNISAYSPSVMPGPGCRLMCFYSPAIHSVL